MSFFGGTTNWDELGAQTVAIAGDGMLEPQVRVRRVNQLFDKGVPVDFEDQDGVTALLAASVTGHIETISALVSRGANVDYETKLQAGTALIVACAAGKLAALGALVRHGANVDYETSSGMTALIVAAAKGQSKAVAALTERGATVDHESVASQTALTVVRRCRLILSNPR
jgi:ankyrin repeat protein